MAEDYSIKPERAQVLPAGAVTLEAIADFYSPIRIIVTTGGVRKGSIINSMSNESHAPSRT